MDRLFRLAPMLTVAVALLASAEAAAGFGFEVGHLDHVATHVTLTACDRMSLGSAGSLVPAPGETAESEVSDWILLVGGGVGISLGEAHDASDHPTAEARLGLLRRTGLSLPDRAGLVLVNSAEPLATGPALRAEVFRALALEVGGLWHDRGLGFRWFAALEVSSSFINDIRGHQ